MAVLNIVCGFALVHGFGHKPKGFPYRLSFSIVFGADGPLSQSANVRIPTSVMALSGKFTSTSLVLCSSNVISWDTPVCEYVCDCGC